MIFCDDICDDHDMLFVSEGFGPIELNNAMVGGSIPGMEDDMDEYTEKYLRVCQWSWKCDIIRQAARASSNSESWTFKITPEYETHE